MTTSLFCKNILNEIKLVTLEEAAIEMDAREYIVKNMKVCTFSLEGEVREMEL